MGISFLSSALFFISILMFSLSLLPSQRELGKFFIDSGMFNKARFYLEKQFHQNPGDVLNAKRYLESLLYYGEKELFIHAGEKLIRIYPNSIQVNELLADFYENIMYYDEAVKYWGRILEINPALKDIKEKFVSYCAFNKKYDLLISFYERQIKSGNGDLAMNYELGRLYLLRKNSNRAQNIFEDLLAKFPYEEKAKLILAEIYEYNGNKEQALLLYRQIFDSKPDDENYALEFIGFLLDNGRNDEALEKLEALVNRFKGNSNFLKLLAELYAKSGKLHEAIDLLEKVYADTSNHSLLKTLAEMYYQSGDDKKALENLRSYHEKTEGDYRSHQLLGDVLLDMGDTSASRREFQRALELLRSGK